MQPDWIRGIRGWLTNPVCKMSILQPIYFYEKYIFDREIPLHLSTRPSLGPKIPLGLLPGPSPILLGTASFLSPHRPIYRSVCWFTIFNYLWPIYLHYLSFKRWGKGYCCTISWGPKTVSLSPFPYSFTRVSHSVSSFSSMNMDSKPKAPF